MFYVDDVYEPINLKVKFTGVAIVDLPRIRQYLDIDLIGSWLKSSHPAHVFHTYRMIRLAEHDATELANSGHNRYLLLLPMEKYNPHLYTQETFTAHQPGDQPNSVPQNILDEWINRMPDLLLPNYFKTATCTTDLQRDLPVATHAIPIHPSLQYC